MQLELTRYRQPLGHFARTFEPSEVQTEQQGDDAYRVVTPVELAFDIHKDKDRFRLAGTARAELELVCSRCLDSFRLPVGATFDVRYHPASEITADAESRDTERAVEEDDLDTSYYRDDQIDLNELLREQFYLALPMKPLCQEGCQGLCPHCGTNRNTGTCACTVGWEDPRLAALKTLK